MAAAILVRLIFWLWFGAALAAGHFLLLQRIPPPATQGLLLLLAGALLFSYFAIRPARQWTDACDLRALILLHLTRFAGVYLLVLHHRGELPGDFAVPAGIGDICVAAFALPVAIAPLEEPQRQRAIRIWNVVGSIDILLAVATAIRFNLADPAQLRAFTYLPLSLQPTFLVPLMIATHVVIFVRLARAQSSA